MVRRVYRLATRLAHRIPLGSGSLAAAIGGRRESEARWLHWARTARGEGPVVWIHAASVGEALTAAPVVRRLRTTIPDIQFVHSYSSHSAAEWPAPFERAHADFSPVDLPNRVTQVLEAVRPTMIVFARGDLWPEFVLQAARRDIPMAVIGGSVRPASFRLRPVVRRLYRSMLKKLSWVGAATDGDVERWLELGVPADRVEATGDPRHDQVLERITDFSQIRALYDWATEEPTLVAGSVEPSDERCLLQAAAQVLSAHRRARLVLAPHSPTEQHVERLVRLAGRQSLEAEVWTPGNQQPPNARCLVLGARGMLFDVYVLGSLAYVGGGFQSGKLHATIEPAAYGLPLLFGPRWHGIPDAETLVDKGGAVGLPAHDNAHALASQWLQWLDDEGTAHMVGLAARQCLTQGAATLTTRRLWELLAVAGYCPSTTPS